MKELCVFSVHSSSFRALPQTTKLLKNLKTLILDWCSTLESISVIGELVNLEILICRGCRSIESLPTEMGRLSRLKLLELSDCRNLKRITPGIISNQKGLEELIVDWFYNSETAGEERERKNAFLSELDDLSSLSRLKIKIKDSRLASEPIRLSPNVVKYDITIGDGIPYRELKGFEKVMRLKLAGNISLGQWIHECVRSVEYMWLEGSADSSLDFGVAHNMRSLTLTNCSAVKKLVNMTTMDTLFPHLEVLRLVKLTELEEIWDINDDPIPSNCFPNLKELRLEFLPALKHLSQSSSQSQINAVSIFSKLSSLHIYGCHELCNLFSLPVKETDSCLLQLEELVIESCDRMEHVFFLNEGENQSNIHVPKLKVLILDSLPKLTDFCKGIVSFEFPSLDRKRISRCPLLKNIVSTDWSPDDDDDYIHLFCKSENKQSMELKLQGNFTLGRNKIQECVEYMSLEGDGSTSLDLGVAQSMRCLTFREFPMGTKLMNMTTIATLFPFIKVLTFRNCLMETKLMNMTTIATPFPLVEVLCVVNIKELEAIWDIDSPKNLNELRLKSLPALKHLWSNSSSSSRLNIISIFNQLSSIYIYECHKMCNLFPLSMTERGSCLLQLERLVIESCDMMDQVFLWNEEKNIHVLDLPKLKVLNLSFLPELKNLCKGIKHIQCPQLVQVKIVSCPKLQSIVYWQQESTFIFNSLRSAQLQRGKGEENPPPPQKEMEGEQSKLIRKTATEDEEGRNSEIEEEQNWKTTTEGGRTCEIEEEQN